MLLFLLQRCLHRVLQFARSPPPSRIPGGISPRCISSTSNGPPPFVPTPLVLASTSPKLHPELCAATSTSAPPPPSRAPPPPAPPRRLLHPELHHRRFLRAASSIPSSTAPPPSRTPPPPPLPPPPCCLLHPSAPPLRRRFTGSGAGGLLFPRRGLDLCVASLPEDDDGARFEGRRRRSGRR
jgi:hypothetical protein